MKDDGCLGLDLFWGWMLFSVGLTLYFIVEVIADSNDSPVWWSLVLASNVGGNVYHAMIS